MHNAKRFLELYGSQPFLKVSVASISQRDSLWVVRGCNACQIEGWTSGEVLGNLSIALEIHSHRSSWEVDREVLGVPQSPSLTPSQSHVLRCMKTSDLKSDTCVSKRSSTSWWTLLEGLFSAMAGVPENSPLASIGQFTPCPFSTLMGRLPPESLNGLFPSWKVHGKQPLKKGPWRGSWPARF